MPETVAYESTPPASPDSHLSTPGSTIVGHYLLLARVGRGGMGTVYRAQDLKLNRIVAVKLLNSAELASDLELERFHREAHAVAQFLHPNIVPVFDVGQHAGQHYFAMGFAHGGTLAEHVERYRQPRAAAELIEKIARGVHYAHSKGILHRDLKLSNILLDERGEPLVSDFGIAKHVDATLELTQTGAQVGTPGYMAPEQLDPSVGPITPATDVWAMGVMLYALTTGRRPFDHEVRTRMEQMVLKDAPSSPRSVCRGLAKDLETIILKCLEKSPAARYASAEALAADLRHFLNEEPIQARPRAWPVRAARKLRRYPVATTLTAVLGLGVLGTAVVVHWADPQRQLTAIERELREQNSVALIRDSGWPKWHRVSAGSAASQVGVPPGRKEFTVSSWSRCYLELMQDPGSNSYEFSAEIKHLRVGDGGGHVGIYFLSSEVNSPNGTELCLCEVYFSDHNSRPSSDNSTLNYLATALRRHGENVDRPTTAATGAGVRYLFVPALTRTEADIPWRRMTVQVRPATIAVLWDGQLINTISAQDLRRLSTRLFALQPAIDSSTAGFSPRGGLGILVADATAAFRNVEIKTLPE
jgi:serine/threonine protein kinase